MLVIPRLHQQPAGVVLAVQLGLLLLKNRKVLLEKSALYTSVEELAEFLAD
jgi:hypothetical protein